MKYLIIILLFPISVLGQKRISIIEDTLFIKNYATGDSIQINKLAVLKTDSAAMLSGYVRNQKLIDSLVAVRNKEVSDSALLKGLINTNTSNISTNTSNINLKLNISDTAAMLSSIDSKIIANTGSINSNTTNIVANTTAIAGKLNISDTASMLSSIDAKIISNTSAINTNTSNIASNTTAISGKEPSIIASNTANKYWNGYKSFVILNSDSLTEGATNLFYTTARAALKAPVASPTFTGTVTIPSGSVLGTPTSINLANATFPTLNQNTTGTSGKFTGMTLAEVNTAITDADVASLTGSETLTNKTIAAGSNTISGLTNSNLSGSAGISNANLAQATEGSSLTAASAAINTTETIVVKSAALAANRLVAGTVIRFTLIGTTTSSAANASTFALRLGTLGTTSDALLATVATAAAATTGTAVPFRAIIELTIRTTTTAYATVIIENTGGTSTGISTVPVQVLLPTMSALNTATANQILSATYKSAATTTTTTFQQAFLDFVFK